MTNQVRALREDDFEQEPATEAGALAAQLYDAKNQIHTLRRQVVSLQQQLLAKEQALLEAERVQLEQSNKKLSDTYGFDQSTILKMDADLKEFYWLRPKRDSSAQDETIKE